MSMKVLSFEFVKPGNPSNWLHLEETGYHLLRENVGAQLTLDIGKFDLVFRDGVFVDGLSVPERFRWYLPSWDLNNNKYNFAGVVHDWLYSVQGITKCFVASRDECDAVFRGILRESGISRFKAGVADKCLQWFAGGKEHWGNDPYKLASHVMIYPARS